MVASNGETLEPATINKSCRMARVTNGHDTEISFTGVEPSSSGGEVILSLLTSYDCDSGCWHPDRQVLIKIFAMGWSLRQTLGFPGST